MTTYDDPTGIGILKIPRRPGTGSNTRDAETQPLIDRAERIASRNARDDESREEDRLYEEFKAILGPGSPR